MTRRLAAMMPGNVCSTKTSAKVRRQYHEDAMIWKRLPHYWPSVRETTLIARFMGSTWGPSGADRTQVGPTFAPWTLLSGHQLIHSQMDNDVDYFKRFLVLAITSYWNKQLICRLGARRRDGCVASVQCRANDNHFQLFTTWIAWTKHTLIFTFLSFSFKW